MSELLAAVVEGILALVQLVFEVIAFLISGAVTLVACLLSKTFRDRKQAEWKGKQVRKFAELGFSGLCLAGLVTFAVWLLLSGANPKKSSDPALKVEQAQKGEEIRLKLQVSNDGGKKEAVTIAVKEGGTARILGTETLKDLKQQIIENVSVIPAQKNLNTNPEAIRGDDK